MRVRGGIVVEFCRQSVALSDSALFATSGLQSRAVGGDREVELVSACLVVVGVVEGSSGKDHPSALIKTYSASTLGPLSWAGSLCI